MTPCPRCGGFKPLVENRWRTLCAECHEKVTHPIERLAFTGGNLIRATWMLWVEHARWLVPLAVVAALPNIAMRLFVPRQLAWAHTAVSLTANTFFECVALLWVARATFSWANAPVGRRLLTRYVPVLTVNLVGTVVATAGMIACFVGALFAGNFLVPGVAFALFDSPNPFRAIAQSAKRVFRAYWVTLAGTAVFGGASLLVGLVDTLAAQVSRVLPRFEPVAQAIYLAAPLGEAQLHVLAQLLELTAWYFLTRQGTQSPPQSAPPLAGSQSSAGLSRHLSPPAH